MRFILVMQETHKKLLSVGLAKALSISLGFLTSVTLARFMGPETFGQYVFAFTVLSLLALPAGASLGQLVMREIASATEVGSMSLVKGFLDRCLQWIAVVSIFLFLAVFAGTITSGSDLIFQGFWIIPLMAIVTFLSETLRGLGFVWLSQWPDLVGRPTVFLALVMAMAAGGFIRPENVLWAYAISLFTTAAVLKWLLTTKISDLLRSVAPSYNDKKWLRATPWFFTISVIAALLSQIPILILGALGLPGEQMAALQLALSFSLVVGLPMVVVNLVVGPRLASLLSQNSITDAVNLSSKMTRLGFLLSLPAGFFLTLYPELIIGTVYGVDFMYSASVVSMMTISAILNLAFGPLSYLLTLSSFERHAAIGQFVGLGVMVILIFLLAREHAALGASIGILVGTFARNCVLVIMCRRCVSAPWLLLTYFDGWRANRV